MVFGHKIMWMFKLWRPCFWELGRFVRNLTRTTTLVTYSQLWPHRQSIGYQNFDQAITNIVMTNVMFLMLKWAGMSGYNEQLWQTFNIGNIYIWAKCWLQKFIVISTQGIKLSKYCKPSYSYLPTKKCISLCFFKCCIESLNWPVIGATTLHWACRLSML